MNKLMILIRKSKNREKYFLYASYVLNVIIVSMFYMVATGLSNITNETLSTNDYEQIMAILGSVILVSGLTIVFFQWIISMQFQALFFSRKQFNNNLRLMGIRKKSLFGIYIYELFYMQLLAFPVGIILSEIIFYVLAKTLNLNEKIITPDKIVIAAILHLIVITASVFITFIKLMKHNIIEVIRGNTNCEELQTLGIKQKVRFTLGLASIIITIYIKFTAQSKQMEVMADMGYSIAILLAFDVIMFYVHKVLTIYAKKYRKTYLLFSEQISFGYYKKVKVVCLIAVYSITIFLGLQMMFKTVRNAGLNVADKNINYTYCIQYDNLLSMDEADKNDQVLYGLRFKTKTSSGSNVYVNGINTQFLSNFETININKLLCDDNSFIKNNMFDDKNWNGIIMPDYYISANDIGNSIILNIDGKDVSFNIIAGYNTNNFGKMICYVSSAYLKSQLNIDNMYNIAYIKNPNNLEDMIKTRFGTVQSKEEIAQESYNKAVSGTKLVEIVSIFIIICAMISLINFFAITSGANIINISRLRGAGMSEKNITKIYIYQAIIPIIVANILAIPLAIIFERIGCYLMLPADYFVYGMKYKPVSLLVVFFAFLAVSIVTQVITIKKVLYTSYYIDILRDVSI
ncbi:hypothetical protein C8E03_10217 [Lachnotalea glycerini]|uniref:ABC3 transporter permease C-terminal domain-containing protein n=1 Tax=Lachnotalea glycerini TaxID=1763509 RepID=A0A318EP54_9FIRM|nr:FtsX-like permease family protein [Lachnotalea glycerini]PXV93251.1 hypothetical protein C8E03_10217 [Lachnotalea glycerini]